MNSKIRIFGFMVALSYIITILYVWMSAEYSGHVYFSAGEPNKIILYTEWVFGLIAVAVIGIEFKKSLDEKAKRIYDPLV